MPKEYPWERSWLAQRFRKTGQMALLAPNGRIVSRIHWDPKQGLYCDNRSKFVFEREAHHLVLYIFERLGWKKNYASVTLSDYETMKPLFGPISGKTVYIEDLGINARYCEPPRHGFPRKAHRGRGVFPAMLDFLKRQGVQKVVAIPGSEGAKQYYEDIGFKHVAGTAGDFALDLQKWSPAKMSPKFVEELPAYPGFSSVEALEKDAMERHLARMQKKNIGKK